METVQCAWLAIDDEMHLNCGMRGWLAERSEYQLPRIWRELGQYLDETLRAQSGEDVPQTAEDRFESSSDAILLVWRLGTSLLALDGNRGRLRESCRLTASQFCQSEYVLFVARLFARKAHKVEFVRETQTQRTPDLKINGQVWLECKQRDPNTRANIRNAFNEARNQIPKGEIGVVCIDLPANLDLSDSVLVKDLLRQVKGELSATKRVYYCFLSQTLFETEGEGSQKVRGLSIRKRLFPNPSLLGLEPPFPPDVDIQYALGGTLGWDLLNENP